MAGMKRTKEELQAENEFLKRGGYAESVSKVLQTGIRFGALAFSVWCLNDAIVSFAGKTSDANVLIQFLTDIQVSNALAWVFGGGGVLYGYKQRSLNGKTVERLQPRIEQLETSFDRNRTSSGLTKTGETNPKDLES